MSCDWHIFSTRFRLKQAEKCVVSIVYRLQFSCTGKLNLVGIARAPERSAIRHPFKCGEDKYITLVRSFAEYVACIGILYLKYDIWHVSKVDMFALVS